MNNQLDVPDLPRKSRVLFVRKDHPESGHYCIVLEPLPNPSHQKTNQWYDVRFEDGRYLRCKEKDLKPVS